MKYLIIISMAVTLCLVGCADSTDPVENEETGETNGVLTKISLFETVGIIWDMIITDNNLYTAEDQAGFAVFDRETSELLKRVTMRDAFIHYANVRALGILEEHDILSVFDRFNNTAIRFYNISDPGNPDYRHQHTGDGISVTRFIEMINIDEGDPIMTISNSNSTFRTSYIETFVPAPVDFTDFPTPNAINDFQVVGEYVYLSAAQRGMYIYKLDGVNASFVAELNMTGDALDVAVKGDYAYLVTKQEGLQIANISDPYNPVWLEENSISTSGWAQSVSAEGDYLAVGSGGGGVYLYDISETPEKPQLIDQLSSSETDYVILVEIHNGELFVADRYKGISKYQINN